jgi:hypothetical protein
MIKPRRRRCRTAISQNAGNEAVAALAASAAQDGDGGRTALLASNLAYIRPQRSEAGPARKPVQAKPDIPRLGSVGRVSRKIARPKAQFSPISAT